EISEDYGLGKVVGISFAPSAWTRRGNRQTNLLVDTGRGKFILRRDEIKGELEVKREIDLLLYLRKHSFPCPQPLTDRKSRHYREIAGTCLIAYKNIDGRRLDVAALNHTQIENIGRTLADLHVIGKGYKKGIDNRFSFERVADLYMEVRAH